MATKKKAETGQPLPTDEAILEETAPEETAAEQTTAEELPAEDTPDATDSPVPEGEGEAPPEEAPPEEKSPPKRRTRKKAAEPKEEEAPAEEPEQPKPDASAPIRDRADIMRNRRQREEANSAARAERDKFYLAWAALQQSMVQKTILYGTVAGIETVSALDSRTGLNVRTVLLNILMDDGNIKVSIPFDEIYTGTAIDMASVDLTTQAGINSYAGRMRAMARKLVKLEIPFVVTMMHIDQDDDTNLIPNNAVAASRKQALAILAERNFGSRNGSRPIIAPGDTVDATIVSVGDNALVVNIGGVDKLMNKSGLTFRFLANARDFYETNMAIPVKIRKVTRRNDGRFDIEASARDVELERAISKHRLFSPGLLVHGTLTTVMKTDPPRGASETGRNAGGYVYALAWIEDYNVPALVTAFAPATLGVRAEPGSEVLLSVRDCAPNGFIRTRCIGATGNVSPFSRYS